MGKIYDSLENGYVFAMVESLLCGEVRLALNTEN